MRIHSIQGSAPYWYDPVAFGVVYQNTGPYLGHGAVSIGRDIGTGPYDLWDECFWYDGTASVAASDELESLIGSSPFNARLSKGRRKTRF